ncbi:hypothetical protein FKW77_002315 [Venturia effusa]|uniref:Uncharacterized protein n=1 Tax=Venturia effusa TaxID=50376 RepID=A0A517LNI5_9PEZI|nr:hypothetical protein FKW77_002315 [Venturia effusa]
MASDTNLHRANPAKPSNGKKRAVESIDSSPPKKPSRPRKQLPPEAYKAEAVDSTPVDISTMVLKHRSTSASKPRAPPMEQNPHLGRSKSAKPAQQVSSRRSLNAAKPQSVNAPHKTSKLRDDIDAVDALKAPKTPNKGSSKFVSRPKDNLRQENPNMGNSKLVNAPHTAKAHKNPNMGDPTLVNAPEYVSRKKTPNAGKTKLVNAPRAPGLASPSKKQVIPTRIPQQVTGPSTHLSRKRPIQDVDPAAPPPPRTMSCPPVKGKSSAQPQVLPIRHPNPLQIEEADEPMQTLQSTQIAPAASQPLHPAQLDEMKDNRYMAALQHGYSRLLYVVFQDEIELRKALKLMEWEVFNMHGWNILAATPTPLLKGVAAGNLARLYYQGDPDVVACVDMIKTSGAIRYCPFIYLMLMCNSRGEGPTARQWRQIAYYMAMYTRSGHEDEKLIDDIFAIDCIGHPEYRGEKRRTERGERRWLKTKDTKNGMPSTLRKERTTKFAYAMSARAASIPFGAWDTERLDAFYGGFAVNPEHRKQQHIEEPSNYLMALSHAIAEHFWPGTYFLEQFAISPLTEPEQAPIGEIVISAMAGCMYNTGMGFNIADPGDSVHGITQLSMKHRGVIEEWIKNYSPFQENIIAQTKMMQLKAKEEKSLRDQIAELKQKLDMAGQQTGTLLEQEDAKMREELIAEIKARKGFEDCNVTKLHDEIDGPNSQILLEDCISQIEVESCLDQSAIDDLLDENDEDKWVFSL